MNAWNSVSEPVQATPTNCASPAQRCAASSTEGASRLHVVQYGAQNHKTTGLPASVDMSISPPPTRGARNRKASGTSGAGEPGGVAVVVATAGGVGRSCCVVGCRCSIRTRLRSAVRSAAPSDHGSTAQSTAAMPRFGMVPTRSRPVPRGGRHRRPYPRPADEDPDAVAVGPRVRSGDPARGRRAARQARRPGRSGATGRARRRIVDRRHAGDRALRRRATRRRTRSPSSSSSAGSTTPTARPVSS